MNKTYRHVWSLRANAWVAAAENARARGRGAAGTLLVAAAAAIGAASFASAAVAAPPAPPAAGQLPTGGQVVAGSAAISQQGAALTVEQSSSRAAIEWRSFDVGSAASVHFAQPGAASVTLNRVLDGNPSQIFGRLTAPGQVFLTNPAGVYFAPGASADVGGLVATTHQIDTAEFMAGNARLSRAGATGSVVNAGELRARLGGYIALLAPEVRNEGVVVAQGGTVALAAGEAYELHIDGAGSLADLRVMPSRRPRCARWSRTATRCRLPAGW